MGATGQVGSSPWMWHASRPAAPAPTCASAYAGRCNIGMEQYPNGVLTFVTSCPFKKFETEEWNSRREIRGLAGL
jgi:hypothetical protein